MAQRFQIVSDCDENSFEQKVNDQLERGWHLHGPMNYTRVWIVNENYGHGGYVEEQFVQALVLGD